MEGSVLLSEAVASEMNAHFIESRLHTDITDIPEMAAVFLELQKELTDNFAAPTYVVYDPVSKRVLRVEEGIANVYSNASFVEFLQKGREAL